jgi:NADH dehydrogenase
VIIIGAGFAGLTAARVLGRAGARVTLVDRERYSTFQPFLYQVATAGLSASDVSYPLRVFAARYRTVTAEMASLAKLRPAERRVDLDNGASLEYDYLILATGVTTNWYGIPGASEHAYPLYTVHDALKMRERLLSLLDQTAAGRRDSCHVVVVGGGATGVETAGTLAELRRRSLPVTFPEIDPSATSVSLVEQLDHVLAPYIPSLRDAAARALSKRGVRLRLGTAVESIEPDAVVLKDGTRMPSDLTIWAVGVTAAKEVADWGLPQTRGGRIVVTEALNVAEHPEVFVAGDLAAAPDTLPQLAQPAIQTGKHVAHQIIAMARGRTAKPFRYRDPGTMAVVGRADAVFQLPGKHPLGMNGPLAWLAWMVLHIYYLLGGRNRVNALTNFLWRYMGSGRNAATVTE